MTISEANARQSGQGDPPAEGLVTGGHRPRRRWWLIGLGGLGAVCILVTAVLAGTYRPVGFGGAWGAGSFPPLPEGVGLRSVNTFGLSNGDLYVPPQRGAFSVIESIQNSGPLAVTIEAVTIIPPGESGLTEWPLKTAGQASYMPEYGPRPAEGSPVAGLSLEPGPGHAIVVGIPARLGGPCFIPSSWNGVNFFYVKERFLFFTHWVAIPLGTPLIFHSPETHAPGMVCPGK